MKVLQGQISWIYYNGFIFPLLLSPKAWNLKTTVIHHPVKISFETQSSLRLVVSILRSDLEIFITGGTCVVRFFPGHMNILCKLQKKNSLKILSQDNFKNYN